MWGYKSVLDLAVAVLDGDQDGQPEMVICEQLAVSLDSTVSGLFHVRPSGEVMRSVAWPDSLRVAADLVTHHSRDDPAFLYLMAHGAMDPLRATDIVAERVWRNTRAYAACRSFLGISRRLAIPVPSLSPVRIYLVMGRPGQEYTEAESDYAGRLQPLLARVHAHFSELRRVEDDPAQCAARAGITPRELGVLGLLSEGLTAAAIARRLLVKPCTVTKHLESIYRKLDTHDRLTTVRVATELGIVQPAPIARTELSSLS